MKGYQIQVDILLRFKCPTAAVISWIIFKDMIVFSDMQWWKICEVTSLRWIHQNLFSWDTNFPRNKTLGFYLEELVTRSLIENKVNKNVLFLAGYVLTRESIRRLVEHGLDQNLCPTEYPGVKDDVTISMFPETILDNLYLKSWVL